MSKSELNGSVSSGSSLGEELEMVAVELGGGNRSGETDAGEPADLDYLSGEAAHALQVYYTPILVLFGTAGNVISIIVFFKSKLWKLSTSHYLSALALSDSSFLVQLLVAWLDAVKICNLINTPGFCQVSVYITYVACNLSAWLVVAFTVERLVAVKHPLKRTVVCTVTRAKYAILILFLLAVTINVPLLRFAKAMPYCNLDAIYWQHADRFNLVDTVISFTVPMATISVLNVWIAAGVLSGRRKRRSLVPATRCQADRQAIDRANINTMLFTVSTVFVILNLPAYTIRLLAYKRDFKIDERWISVQHLSMAMFNTNFGINFILYCLSGQNFRRALGALFYIPEWFRRCCRCERLRKLFRRRGGEARLRRVPTPLRAHIHNARRVCPADAVSEGVPDEVVAALTPPPAPRSRPPRLSACSYLAYYQAAERRNPPPAETHVRVYALDGDFSTIPACGSSRFVRRPRPRPRPSRMLSKFQQLNKN